MKIAISGNLYMLPDILEIQEELEEKNHSVVAIYEYVDQLTHSTEKKKEKDRKTFFQKMKFCDALLVINKSLKAGKKNYISGSSFLEMGFAHALGKKIYLLQDIPEVSFRDEILAMKPVLLHGNLNKIN